MSGRALSLVLQNVIAMHAGKVLYSSCAGKHGTGYKTNFMSLKAVLAFQTLMLATLGKWATTHDRVIFFGQELLLDFAAWIDLTSNADNLLISPSCIRGYGTHFVSLKHVDDLRVYQGFMMPFNHQAGYKVFKNNA